MKKTLVLTLALILALSLAACGGRNSGDGQDTTDTTIPEGRLMPSIVPAAGWEEMESAVPAWQKDGSMIMLTVDIIPQDEVSTPEEFVIYAQDKLKESFEDAAFGATSQTKVNGMNAVEYTYTIQTWGVEQTFRVLYICTDIYAYTITCSSMDFEAVNTDFQRMIDSFTLS